MAAGNSAQARNYQWMDRDPRMGTNLYRLREVDLDGQEQFSPVRSVTMRSLNSGIRLVPDPGNGLVTALLSENASGSVLFVLDAMGREVGRYRIDGTRTTFDLSALSHGLYGLRLIGPSGDPTAMGTWVRE
jgi:hypothetical protein